MPREALDKKYKPATCLTPKSARSAHHFHPFVRDQINSLKSLNRAASMTEEAPRHALSPGATLSATAQALSSRVRKGAGSYELPTGLRRHGTCPFPPSGEAHTDGAPS